MAMKQPEPVFIAAKNPPSDPEKGAAIVFIHGFGDSASAWEGVVAQFQDNDKLPYMSWTLPDAPEHHEAMMQSWYMPTPLTAFPSQRPELDDPEDEEGMLRSVRHFEDLIDGLVAKGIPANRIVCAGFSQGCAMTFLLGLTSAKYSGKLGGLAGLAGYLPLAERIPVMRKDAGLPEKVENVPIFCTRGQRDMLVPRRYHSHSLEKLKEFGVHDEFLEVHEYQGLGHAVAGPVLKDLCSWLEKHIPPLE